MNRTRQQAALQGYAREPETIAPLAADADLSRILHLYELVKRYELLVEFLLDNTYRIELPCNGIDEVRLFRGVMAKRAITMANGSKRAAADLLELSEQNYRRWFKEIETLEPSVRSSYDTQVHSRTTTPPQQSNSRSNKVRPCVPEEGANSTVEAGAEIDPATEEDVEVV